MQEERFWETSLTLLNGIYEFLDKMNDRSNYLFANDDLLESRLRAVIMISQIVRWSEQIEDREGLVFQITKRCSELIQLVEAFAGARVFERDKVLYVAFLREVSLLYYYLERWKDFEQAEHEHHRICDLLGLGLTKALYTLDLADMASNKDFEQAKALYHRSSERFRVVKCDVGYANAREGEAIMMILSGELDDAETLLKNILRTYRSYGLEFRVAIAWIVLGGIFLMKAEKDKAAAYFKMATTESRFERYKVLRSTVKELSSCKDNERIRISQLIITCWREGYRISARENIAMSGWLTAKDLRGDRIFDTLFPPEDN